MKIHDVSLTIRPGMTVWPGDPKVELYRQEKIEDGANANVSFMGIGVHTGTHVDAPYHFLQDGKTVETLPLDVLVGKVLVVELDDNINEINWEVIEPLTHTHGVERILFKTRNSRYWLESGSEFQENFVGITVDGAQSLVEMGVRLVGIDYLSIAPFKKSRPTHEVLLKSNIVLIEGLDLFNVSPGEYTLYCLPLKLLNTDGAPARVILIEE